MTNRARVFLSKAEDLLPRLPADSFDSIVCDPPYGLAELKPEIVTKALTAWLAGDRMHVPNGRGFMGREWDKFVPPPGIWDECYRVLKPGGHMLVFAGARTHGLMDISIRLAGFEVRDSLMWCFGSGMPKGLNVSKAIDKAAGAQRDVTGPPTRHGGGTNGVYAQDAWTLANQATMGAVTAPATEDAARWQGWNVALKPAHEPIILARKPLSEGTVAANVLRWGTGALNVDGCKVGTGTRTNNAGGASSLQRVSRVEQGYRPTVTESRNEDSEVAGRWPPNLLLTHSADCQPAGTRRVNGTQGGTTRDGVGVLKYSGANSRPQHADSGGSTQRPGYADTDGTETVQAFTCAPDCPVAGLDAQSGVRPGFSSQRDLTASNGTKDVYGAGMKIIEAGTKREGYNDTGGASRFFPAFTWSLEYDLPFLYQAKAPKKERPRIVADDGRVIQHPTIKPLSLCRWLVRLVTPPGGTVGDFFTGTGPVVQAALDEGMRCVACDQDPDSVALSRVRLAPYAGVRFTVPESAVPEPAGQPDAEAECG